MGSRIGEGPKLYLEELTRTSSSSLAAHAEALPACKQAALIWHAYTQFRKALQVLVSDAALLILTDIEQSAL